MGLLGEPHFHINPWRANFPTILCFFGPKFLPKRSTGLKTIFFLKKWVPNFENIKDQARKVMQKSVVKK